MNTTEASDEMKHEETITHSDAKPVLLLTAAVDAGKAPGALFSPPERRKQYLEAFRFYVRFLARNPSLCGGIVFCENTGADLSSFRKEIPFEQESVIELISLPPDSFASEKGKTWNEMLAIDLAVASSRLLRTDVVFVKCTGRYPVLNIKRLCSDIRALPEPVSLCYFRLPGRRDRKARYRPLVDTRCVAFRKCVWCEHFQGLYKTADESRRWFFEYIVFDVIEKHGGPNWLQGFSRPPLILGKQGHKKRIGRFVLPKWLEPVYLLAAWFHHWRTM